MDDRYGHPPEDEAPKDPAEGVRIIGAEEAAEALERGDVAPRLPDSQPRFGDRPPSLPEGVRPALRFPLSLSPADGSPTVVRTTLSIDEAAQSMTFAGDIPEGARVRFMHASYEDVLDGAAQAAEQTGARAPELVICVSCVGRRLVLGQRTEEELEQVRDYVGPQAVLAGFYSYGELAPAGREAGCLLHNQTMTITAFAEA